MVIKDSYELFAQVPLQMLWNFKRSRKCLFSIAITTFIFGTLFITHSWTQSPRTLLSGNPQDPAERLPTTAPDPKIPHSTCAHLPGIESIFIVLKTGATESQKKLPIHFRTLLKCVSSYVLVSDLDERVEGHPVLDVLANVSSDIVQNNKDFILYKELLRYQQESLNISDLVDTPDKVKMAWNLDKWKFLPMMTKAYQTRNDAKWYLFIEADTYIVLSTLLIWLNKLTSEKPWYIGGQSWIAGHIFAHGGTGYVISNPAMKLLTDMLAIKKKEMEELTSAEWAGDLVLAKALEQVGVDLTPSWPIFQGETPYSLDYTERHFCFPVVSYHHVDAEWIQRLWDFEQEWISEHVRYLRCDRPTLAKFLYLGYHQTDPTQ